MNTTSTLLLIAAGVIGWKLYQNDRAQHVGGKTDDLAVTGNVTTAPATSATSAVSAPGTEILPSGQMVLTSDTTGMVLM